uniref:Uncharacterized protein n=1 Tax=Timema monikensis TaxID=170555 RepID=A0A7R9EIG2_9NEOP|nr:unnamed protein product [Timema monikensis]
MEELDVSSNVEIWGEITKNKKRWAFLDACAQRRKSISSGGRVTHVIAQSATFTSYGACTFLPLGESGPDYVTLHDFILV